MASVGVQRAAMVAVSVLSLLGCLALAWWQWDRYSSASGTWQNLGYVLQWPLFGLFPAFVFWRMRRLREQARQAEQSGEVAEQEDEAGEVAEQVRAPVRRPNVTQAASGEPDDELAAYNRYLAELNARAERRP